MFLDPYNTMQFLFVFYYSILLYIPHIYVCGENFILHSCFYLFLLFLFRSDGPVTGLIIDRVEKEVSPHSLQIFLHVNI